MRNDLSTELRRAPRPDVDAVMQAYKEHVRQQNPKKYARMVLTEAMIERPIDPVVEAKVAAWWEETREAREIRSAERNRARAARRLAPEYALLGVPPGASQQAIKKAYPQKARELHPDAGGDAAAMARVNAAYQKLSAKQK